MAQTYKIAAVATKEPNAPKEWQGQYGPMVDYKIKLEGDETIITLTQKKETPAPTKGQELFGTIDMSGQYGPKFKKEQRNPGGGGGGGGRSNYVDHHEDIKAEWAIGVAAERYGEINKVLTPGQQSIIKANATYFHSLVDEIKGENPAPAQASGDGFDDGDPGPSDANAPAASSTDIGDDPINLDDIPF